MLEEFSSVLSVLATIFGSMMSLAYFPQAYKMYKRKSSGDISLMTFSVFIVGMVFWLLYGVSINNFPLILSNSIGLVGGLSVIAAYFHYRK